MGRTTNGRVFLLRGKYAIQYYIDGREHKHLLRDGDGNPIPRAWSIAGRPAPPAPARTKSIRVKSRALRRKRPAERSFTRLAAERHDKLLFTVKRRRVVLSLTGALIIRRRKRAAVAEALAERANGIRA
ncbi:MAG: hypothetical protein LBP75_09705 [Planctomycetota bacterium]|jgi:hypothetical protein|nr:hypothetical protein [Planctomycetota bacterium]